MQKKKCPNDQLVKYTSFKMCIIDRMSGRTTQAMSKPSISVTSKSFLLVINNLLDVEGINSMEYIGKKVPGHTLGRDITQFMFHFG